MNQLSEVTETLNNLSLSNTETKPKRGRPSKPDSKDENGRYICQVKWHKEKYEENPLKNIERCTKHQTKYRESFKILKELVEEYNMEFPSPIKEKINKLMCF